MNKELPTKEQVETLLLHLATSLSELRTSIGVTREIIRKRDGDNVQSFLNRLDDYEKIVDQQQDLLPTIRERIEAGDENEATLAIKRVKSLGEFLLEDSKELIAFGIKRTDTDKTGLH